MRNRLWKNSVKSIFYNHIKAAKNGAAELLLAVPAIFVFLPVLLLITGSITGRYELGEALNPLYTEGSAYVSWKWMPDYPSFENYGKLLFETPQFLVLFWNSIKLTGCILAGQLLCGIPAAWAFAVYRFRWGKELLILYIILMLLPFQVSMLSGYLVMNKLGIMNTHLAIILPAVFSTFPVFVCYGGFNKIPLELLESARIDGAGEMFLFIRIGLPLGANGILSAVVLGFLEYWNLMEQPLAYLKDKALWPLSLYLPEITWQQAGYAFTASVITLIPTVFTFLLGQDYLEKGIIYTGLKG